MFKTFTPIRIYIFLLLENGFILLNRWNELYITLAFYIRIFWSREYREFPKFRILYENDNVFNLYYTLQIFWRTTWITMTKMRRCTLYEKWCLYYCHLPFPPSSFHHHSSHNYAVFLSKWIHAIFLDFSPKSLNVCSISWAIYLSYNVSLRWEFQELPFQQYTLNLSHNHNEIICRILF